MDFIPRNSREYYSRANEENLAGWLPIFGRLGQLFDDHPCGVRRSITDLPISLFNSLMETRLEAHAVDSAILAVKEDATRRNVPLLWWIGPSSRPVDLGLHLEQHGFVLEDDGPGMAVELKALKEDLVEPQGLTVRLARDKAELREWTTAMFQGFEAPEITETHLNAWAESIYQADAQVLQAFTGYLDGAAVAASALLVTGEIAGIYCVGTIPAARRKGIGAWMTHFPLLKAREMGSTLGILQASEMGLPVYRSIGFEECCRISSYRWKPG